MKNFIGNYFIKKSTDKRKKYVNKIFEDFIKEHGKEVGKFAVAVFGTGLTIHRDGEMKDDDIDFFVQEKNLKKFKNWIHANNFKVKHKIFFGNIETQTTILYKNVLIDFNFVIKNKDIYNLFNFDLAWQETILSLGFKRKKPNRIYFSNLSNIKTNYYKTIKYISSDYFYEGIYGEKWSVPIKYSYQLKDEYNSNHERQKIIFLNKNNIKFPKIYIKTKF